MLINPGKRVLEIKMKRRMNLVYGKATDMEYSFIITAAFVPIPNSFDFNYSFRNQIETNKTPKQILDSINRKVCQDLFGTWRGYGYYLIGNSPLRVKSFKSRDREKSLANILYLPATSFSNDSEEIKETLDWNILINNLASNG